MIRFLKNRDILMKTIEKIEKKEGIIVVKHKTKKQIILIQPFIRNKNLLKSISNKDHITILTLNTKENLDFVMNNWKQLVKNPKLNIYFVNPFSKMEKKWVIFPYTHNLVSDKASLRQGILSLFNTVDVLTEEEAKKIIN